ncbi:hypothetical protein [Formivibrio citricus]|nr:hypothetical protein [Formivibrio citricus]
MAAGVSPAAGLPSHFSDKVEAALACRSEWSPAYWRSYFQTYLGKPLRVWGEAEWYKVEGAELAGNQAKEAFVNMPESTALMVGVLIEAPVADVRKKIQEKLGMAFVELPGPYPRYLSKTGSVLVGLANPQKPQTKWYCARWNLGNRP